MIAILHLAMGREVTVTPKAENGVDSRTSRRIFHHEEQRMSIDSAQRGAARRAARLAERPHSGFFSSACGRQQQM